MPRRINWPLVIFLCGMGHSQRQVAHMVGCSAQAVYQIWKRRAEVLDNA